MSRAADELGPGPDEARRLGPDGATRIRTFRLIVLLAGELRTLMDQVLKTEGVTTQQAALITVVDLHGAPSLTEAARALGTTHQNVKQIAVALERKGFVTIAPDPHDGRVRRLRTTAKSRRTWQRRSRSDHEMVLEWFSHLDAGEAQQLFELLARLESGVRAALAA